MTTTRASVTTGTTGTAEAMGAASDADRQTVRLPGTTGFPIGSGSIWLPQGANPHAVPGPAGSPATSTAFPATDHDTPTPSVDVLKLGGTPLGRFHDLGLIGKGGMGEVRRVRDPELQRTMAIKLIHPALLRDANAVARFIEEAQITAQLQHPAIVAVHGMGRLADGRVWFSMPEVRGQTLRVACLGVHEASRDGEWRASRGGWTLRRLLGAFLRACQAVAFAHDRGVVHRDLKPDNIMVGDFGEVQVLDWGLAKLFRRADGTEPSLQPVEPAPRTGGRATTQVGRVLGTPAYMAPEQARGQPDQVGPHTDVYALGAVLFELLTGRPALSGVDGEEILARARAGRRQPLQGRCQIPDDLADLVSWAMRPEPANRCPRASVLAERVEAWLDGARRRAMAMAVVAQSDDLDQVIDRLETREATLRSDAERALAGVPDWAPEADKAHGWAREDEADRVRAQRRLAGLRQQETLRSALHLVPDLREAHHRLARIYRAAHERAEARRDTSEATRLAFLLAQHDPEGQHARYLQGDGTLSLQTHPAGARVRLHRFTDQHRRRVAVPIRDLGRTPLHAVALPMGSYLLELSAPGHTITRYPVHISRRGAWDGTGASAVHLLREGDLGPDDIHVPGGPFTCGGLPELQDAEPRRTERIDSFVIKRLPVTNRQYITFLDALVADGSEAEALRHVPRLRPGVYGEQGAMVYGRDAEGGFGMAPDAYGNEADLDAPVCLIDWHGATAYAAWEAARTGLPWRLPTELEWEKAARGADGRFFPWGDAFDESWANMRRSRDGNARLDIVESFPADRSPYGVRGLAGNARDWCLDAYVKGTRPKTGIEPDTRLPDDAARVVRGGSWSSRVPKGLNAAYRVQGPGTARDGNLGFRLARSVRGG